MSPPAILFPAFQHFAENALELLEPPGTRRLGAKDGPGPDLYLLQPQPRPSSQPHHRHPDVRPSHHRGRREGAAVDAGEEEEDQRC